VSRATSSPTAGEDKLWPVLSPAIRSPATIISWFILNAKFKHAVEKLSAQGADEPLADRVHVGRLDGSARDPGAGSLEDGVGGCGEVRSAV
jgi:hypothetical protein